MGRPGLIISNNLGVLKKGEKVEILSNNEKFLGKTVKERYHVQANQVVVCKDLGDNNFDIIVIDKTDVKSLNRR